MLAIHHLRYRADNKMRHDFFDRFSRLNSPIHHLPSYIKLLISIGIIFSVVIIPIHYRWFFFIFLGVLILVSYISKIPWHFIGGRLLFLEPFALGIAVMSLFQHNGLAIFLSILIKSTLCLLTVILLSNTTPFSEILSLLRRIGVPTLLITVLALTYRYLFVLTDEAARLRRARDSRMFVVQKFRIWLSLTSLLAQLFIRSTERSERIYTAMISRGWK
jgi:cobalt/nickel transport system permease protein